MGSKLAVALWACTALGASAARAQAPEPTRPPPSRPPADAPGVEEPPQPPVPMDDPGGDASAPQSATPATTEPQGGGSLRERVGEVIQARFPGLVDDVAIETTPEGLVVVSGTVPLLANKIALSDALAAMPEAAVVANRTVPKAVRRSDGEITREVRGRLRAQPSLRGFAIKVKTEAQRVFLTGTLPGNLAVEAALREAAMVPGVRDVVVSGLRTEIAP